MLMNCIEIQKFGLALHLFEPAEFWLLLTDKYSQNRVLEDQIGKLNAKNCRIVQPNDCDFFSCSDGVLCHITCERALLRWLQCYR